MNESVITGIFTIIGTLLGFIVKYIFDFIREKRERKDKYYFALLEKRFETYQKAYALTEELKSVIHAESTRKDTVTKDAKSWYHDNCLYLTPNLRKEILDVINKVNTYDLQLEDYKNTFREKGKDNEETKNKKEILNQTFANITEGIQEKIQALIDNYYKYIS